MQRKPDPLEPDDQHEHEAAASKRGQQAGDASGREGPDAEEAEPEHGLLGAKFDEHEDAEHRQAAEELGEHKGRSPASRVIALQPPAA